MKCFFAVEVIDYMSDSLLCSMHMVLVCINIRFFHIARGALNRDFRKARTDKRRASSMGYSGTKPLWKIDLLKTPTLYTTFHFMEAKDRCKR